MKFSIELGETEKHRLEYHFNQLLGTMVIKVNQNPILQSRRLVNEPLKEVYRFQVGAHEKWTIRIEKERKPLLGQRNRLYVNERLVKVTDGV